MIQFRPMIVTGVIAGVLGVASGAHAQSVPPADAKPLSGIIKTLEEQGYRVTEVEFEGDHWQIEAYPTGSDNEVELKVDAKSGERKKD